MTDKNKNRTWFGHHSQPSRWQKTQQTCQSTGSNGLRENCIIRLFGVWGPIRRPRTPKHDKWIVGRHLLPYTEQWREDGRHLIPCLMLCIHTWMLSWAGGRWCPTELPRTFRGGWIGSKNCRPEGDILIYATTQWLC